MHISFILVKPAVSQNIGAAARAINTMGFEELRIVAPQCDPLDDNAWYMAHGSTDILQNATIFQNLGAAVADIDFCIGTTARKRKGTHGYIPVPDIPAILSNKMAMINAAAVVFGSEKHGLTNVDLALCHCVSTIPMGKKFPSLNLSQAVMVYAYELSSIRSNGTDVANYPSQYAALVKKTGAMLINAGLPASSGIHRRIIERMALLPINDLHCIHSLCTLMEKRFTS
jgi:tRNA/rRNA methyltransferase